ncbi:MAG: NAD(+) diphosphatase [Leptonema illini]|uniref:NAD(+) diphosphatase n=1 Tax=Leptonema illini TaxID=183 RepID=A0A833GW53_9LEPT|nr:MAG: NAD(+) diphosphatase [Leptonema illini]
MLNAHYFIFSRGKILIRRGRVDVAPLAADRWPAFRPHAGTVLPMGEIDGAVAFAVELLPGAAIDEDLEWLSLRSLVGEVDDSRFNLWGKAAQLLHWHGSHRYCGRCGRPTQAHASDQALVCPDCSLVWYPRISPCVIVLVTRGNELLLARSPRFREGMYSTLAGFIEPGESAEEALRREVREEVAIEVGAIRYFGSQPWPFPGQLMLGFFAQYASGEIAIDGLEISDAGWYHCRRLPPVPGEGTIAGQMIREYLRQLDCDGGA